MPVFSKEVSKIKMVILTQHGHENETWWSPINQNKWSTERIIMGMLGRFKKHRLFTVTNMIYFYQNGVLVQKVGVNKITNQTK